MFNNVSADGYFSRLDGNLDWVVQDPEVNRAAISGSATFDSVLFGRRTYDMFASYWPHALDDPATNPQSPHMPREITPEVRSMAVFLNEATKMVFSRTLRDPPWKNTHVMTEFDPTKVEELKRSPGGDILIFGSGTIVTRLSQHKLIDEYQFVVRPVLLGEGQSLLKGTTIDLPLRLEEARGFPSGSILVRYTLA